MSYCICFESTIHGLDAASRMIARYAAFEPLYTQRTSAIKTELEKIAGLDIEVGRLARISDAQVQLQMNMHKTDTILVFIQTPLSRVVDASTMYARTVGEQQFRELLRGMSSVPYS